MRVISGPGTGTPPRASIQHGTRARADPPEGSPNDVAALLRFAGAAVRVRLTDGTTWTGVLRTDLLTERSVSVFLLGCGGGEGVTLYIHQIADIVPLPISAE